jgi:hypothetical protein
MALVSAVASVVCLTLLHTPSHDSLPRFRSAVHGWGPKTHPITGFCLAPPEQVPLFFIYAALDPRLRSTCSVGSCFLILSPLCLLT